VKVYTITGNKGGTGKTTCAVNISHGLALRGYSVLLIDLDTGEGVGNWFNVSADRNLYDFVKGTETPEAYAVNVRDNLDAILSEKGSTAALDGVLRADKERLRLAERLGGASYDYTILDAGPGFRVLNIAGIRAADGLIVPVTLDVLALTGLREIQNDVVDLRALYGTSPGIDFVIPSCYDKRTRLAADVLAILDRDYKGKVTPPLRINVKLREAPGFNKTCYEYGGRRGRNDFDRITDFILRKGGK
jgi:chromosome partitioning protein